MINIGDRVVTSNHGSGLVVNIERFDEDGKPWYDTEKVDNPPGLQNRWGVKLDINNYPMFTNGIAYFVNKDLKHEH